MPQNCETRRARILVRLWLIAIYGRLTTIGLMPGLIWCRAACMQCCAVLGLGIYCAALLSMTHAMM